MTGQVQQAAGATPQAHNTGRIFGILLAAGIVGILFFALTITAALPDIMAALNETEPPPPRLVLIAVILVQYGGLTGVAVWGGLTLAGGMVRTPAPILAGLAPDGARRLLLGSALGFVAGLLMLAAYRWVFFPLTGIPLNAVAEQSLVLRLGNAFFYGGITEELLMRLGLTTALAWVVWRLRGRTLSAAAFWGVNGVVWVLFALAHLPSAVLLMGVSLTPAVVLMALALNSVSLLLGWLYWRYGIETAIAAHIAVHVGYTLLGTTVFAIGG
jgi:hypothetical protein